MGTVPGVSPCYPAAETAHLNCCQHKLLYCITVCASARHPGEVMRALAEKAKQILQNGTLKCCPHNFRLVAIITRPQTK